MRTGSDHQPGSGRPTPGRRALRASIAAHAAFVRGLASGWDAPANRAAGIAAELAGGRAPGSRSGERLPGVADPS